MRFIYEEAVTTASFVLSTRENQHNPRSSNRLYLISYGTATQPHSVVSIIMHGIPQMFRFLHEGYENPPF